MGKLIVSEKHNVAKRIAQILSGNQAKPEMRGKVPVYVFLSHGEEVKSLGLKGHILKVDFPRQYNNWQEIDPVKLIDAPLVKEATQKSFLKALREEAKKAREVVIACDFDREGEVIGVDVANLIKKDNPKVQIKRARFSALTEQEIKEAFAHLEEPYLSLAQAGEARQDIDLIWGATLTRFLSLASFRLGRQFLSVGRVQSPTLVLIAEKEKERQAFVVKPYWQIKGFFQKDQEKFLAYHSAIRFWEKEKAQKIISKLGKKGEVKKVEAEEKVLNPPAPFNTTAFLSAAASLRISPPEAMRIAENLYNQGFISYPRVDNTVYPPSLDLKGILGMLLKTSLRDLAKEILSQEKIVPTRGKTQATDHPPIYPTEAVKQENLRPREWKIYELVCRRFMATLAEEARQKSLKVVIEVSREPFILKGLTTLKPGWLGIYPYLKKKDEEIPALKEKEEVELLKTTLEEKETQPPPRYSQGRLIKEMEARGLGTKCLPGDTLVKTWNGERLKEVKIEDLFSQGVSKKVFCEDGEAIEVAKINNQRSLSLDGTGFIKTPFYGVSRRVLRENEAVYQIGFEDGTSLKATGEHPIAIYDNHSSYKYIPCQELSAKDKVISFFNSEDKFEKEEVIFTWEEFLSLAEKDGVFSGTRLYGNNCGSLLKEKRKKGKNSQYKLAKIVGCPQSALSDYERDKGDIPLWLLGKLGFKPKWICGLNKKTVIPNPFPLKMSPPLSRILAHFLGDGSVSIRKKENCFDLRYHNTNEDLINQVVKDVEDVFKLKLNFKQAKRRKNQKQRFYVSLPGVVGRILLMVAPEIAHKKAPKILTPSFYPFFIGALFDDEGHVNKNEPKIFISNTSHRLLEDLKQMLETLGIESIMDEKAHKLHIRSRRNLQLFLEKVPLTSLEEKRVLLQNLTRHYKYGSRHSLAVIERNLFASLEKGEKTTQELATEFKMSSSSIQKYIRHLRQWGYLEKVVYGNNKDIPRLIKYRNRVSLSQTFYSLVGERFLSKDIITKTVKKVWKVPYTGYVYDILNVKDFSNFVLANNVVVHNSTRHLILKNLYDRSYAHSDPIVPTELGLKVAEALKENASPIATPQMTAELEKEMDLIAEGKLKKEKVVDDSRVMLAQVMLELKAKKKEVGQTIREGIKGDKTVGTCPSCGSNLRIIRAKKTGKRFVGCGNFPKCLQSYPLPQLGEVIALREVCEHCLAPKIKVIKARAKPWILCLDPKCPSKHQKTEDRRQKTEDRRQKAEDRIKI